MNAVEQSDDAVSSRAAAKFARDGFVCMRGLIDRKWLSRLGDIFEALKAQGRDLSRYYADGDETPSPDKGTTIVQDNCWQLNTAFLEFLLESPLARGAATVLGSQRVRIFEDLLIYKSAGSEQPTPWHQDEPQWPLKGRQMGSGWFCLDPVDLRSGALQFVNASHRGALYEPFVPADRQSDIRADGRFFDAGPLPDVAADPDRYPATSFDVEPGDVVFFHPRVIHSAYGSASTHARRTFSVRFLGDDVRWLPKRSVFHDWLKHVPLQEGDSIEGGQFPILWESERRDVRES